MSQGLFFNIKEIKYLNIKYWIILYKLWKEAHAKNSEAVQEIFFFLHEKLPDDETDF